MFPKLRDEQGDTAPQETVVAATPVPDRLTVSGLEGSLLTTTKDAVSVSAVDGLKVIRIVQLPEVPRFEPLAQVPPPATAKSAACGPEMVMALEAAKMSAEVPVLVTVTV